VEALDASEEGVNGVGKGGDSPSVPLSGARFASLRLLAATPNIPLFNRYDYLDYLGAKDAAAYWASARYCSNCGADNWGGKEDKCRLCGWLPGNPTPQADTFYITRKCSHCGGAGSRAYTGKRVWNGPIKTWTARCNWCYGKGFQRHRKEGYNGRARFVQNQPLGSYGILGDGSYGCIEIRQYLRKKECRDEHHMVGHFNRKWAYSRLEQMRDACIKCKECGKKRGDWESWWFRTDFSQPQFCSRRCFNRNRDREIRLQRKRERDYQWLREARETLKAVRKIARERASGSLSEESTRREISAIS